MGRKIIRPVGRELLTYINNGYPICEICGALMDYVMLSETNHRYICPACGYDIDKDDYIESSSDEWAPNMANIIDKIED